MYCMFTHICVFYLWIGIETKCEQVVIVVVIDQIYSEKCVFVCVHQVKNCMCVSILEKAAKHTSVGHLMNNDCVCL